MTPRKPLLEVSHLKVHYPIRRGFLNRVHGQVKAVDGVSFSIVRGETLGLVGESGSGKTTIGRGILRAVEPTEGSVVYHHADGTTINVTALRGEDLRRFRRHVQLIFQDPFSSLNPRMSVRDIVGEPLVVNDVASGRELDKRVADLLEQVGLKREHMRRYPHAFSGGQRQRIGIARALALGPELIIADEPVSALDVSVQAQVINLLLALQERLGLAYLFVAHDLSVVRHIAHRIAVMYLGHLVEITDAQQLFATPKHPYTASLMKSVPQIHYTSRDKHQPRAAVSGEIPDPSDPPSGCRFHPRCPRARDVCRDERPPLIDLSSPGEQPHFTACHFPLER